MSKFEDCIARYKKEFDKIGVKYDEALLRKVAKGCGPSIYSADASKVSSGDPKELERVKKNFLIKKLGLKDTPRLDDAIKDVVAAFGKGNRNKFRAMFYYMLAVNLRKKSHYNDK